MSALLLLRVATRPFRTLDRFQGTGSTEAARERSEADSQVSVLAARIEGLLHEAAGPKSEAADERSVRARLALLAIKRDVHNRRLGAPVDAAAAALLPEEAVGLLASYRDALGGLESASSRERAAVESDLSAGRRALLEATRDPLVREGIALASRSLAAKIAALSARAPGAWGHGDRHVAAKALAYVARFASKTSPNSVFCATALATASGEACAISGRPGIARVEALLSIAEARKVACVLAFDPAVEAAVTPRPNPTLRAEDGALTFWRFASARNPNDDEKLTRVKDHPVVRVALEEAAARRLALPELRRAIASRTGVDEGSLAPFLRQMIDTGVLVAEIEIPYNERRPLRHVARKATEAGCAVAWASTALALEDDVDRLALLDPASRGTAMDGIARRLAELPHAREIRTDELFRLDAEAGLEVALPGWPLDALRSGLRPYVRLFSAMYPAAGYRAGWVRRYLARFPADADVELLDVYRTLTEEGESFRPAAFPEPEAGAGDDPARHAISAARSWFAARARETAPGGEIAFADDDLLRLLPGAREPRWACGVLFQLAARSAEAIARGDARVVLNGLFQGAGLSLSRFAHLLGGEAQDDGNVVVRELKRAWSVVARPGAEVAELTYNHLGRTANAGLRPAIFALEIELPGDTASGRSTAVPLAELTVRFDTSRQRFALRWRPRGIEIVPVINSGVNPVGFISFLVAIGEQELQPVGYLPGFDHPEIVRWPRVVCGPLVLFRERWVFRRGGWPEAASRGDDLLPFVRAADAWRREHGLPRHVYAHTSREPKPRYVDLESPVFLDLLRREIAALDGQAPTLHVTEMLPGPDDLFVRDGEDAYACEFLAQMDGG